MPGSSGHLGDEAFCVSKCGGGTEERTRGTGKGI